MACNTPYYLRPYFWFLIFAIILFIIFIALIETNQSFTSTGFMSAGIWVLFIFIIVFFIISLIWYYYDMCFTVVSPITNEYVLQYVSPVENISNVPCSLDIHEKVIIDEEYIPLSALNPLL